jgi:hypothetical protein
VDGFLNPLVRSNEYRTLRCHHRQFGFVIVVETGVTQIGDQPKVRASSKDFLAEVGLPVIDFRRLQIGRSLWQFWCWQAASHNCQVRERYKE